MVDFFLVPGERARNYLLRSGVLAGKIWTGLYSVDVDRFAIVAGLRKARSDWPRSLLFVGQYVERKGVPELLKAFSQHSGGWKLVLCGAGPLKGLIANYCKHCPNIIDRGFVQPADLPAVMAEAGAFILPSREDNWPLVLIEAGAAGLPLICSRACGSSGELVREGVNGFLLESVNVQGINELILKLASMSVYGLREMGAASAVLVSEYSAVRWAQRLWSNLSEALPTEKSLRNASHSSGFSKIW
jgi:glycosyltransferase involved in cell wall biosynthesis